MKSQTNILTDNGFDFYSNEIHEPGDAFSITIRPTCREPMV